MNPDDYVLYLVVADCPACSHENVFVESRDREIGQMQNVSITHPVCEYCQADVARVQGEFDYKEEYQIETVLSEEEQ
jgi:hypothetical protein